MKCKACKSSDIKIIPMPNNVYKVVCNKCKTYCFVEPNNNIFKRMIHG
jgi:hypothetical protein